MSEQMLASWLRWMTDQVVGMRLDIREIKRRQAAQDGKSKWAWLRSVPWKAIAYFAGWTLLLVSGHAGLPEFKGWLIGLLH